MQDEKPDTEEVPKEAEASWQYTNDQTDNSSEQPVPVKVETLFEWSAAEYVDHNKNKSWYALLVVVILGIAAGVYFLTHGIFSPIIIVAFGSIFFVGAMHKPKVIDYEIDNQGVNIGTRFYPYGEFKSFSLNSESVGGSISFAPLRRFSPGANIYFDKTDEKKIVDALSGFLPNQQVAPDTADMLLRKIRF